MLQSIYRGCFREYSWIVSSETLDDPTSVVVPWHRGLHLYIVAFDGSPLELCSKEVAAGWSLLQNSVAVSPPLEEALEVPTGGYDEWYICEGTACIDAEIEIFVNYGGFNLECPTNLAQSFGATQAGDKFDFLAPIQERFWNQIERYQPHSYIATGDNLIIVSRKKGFVAEAEKYLLNVK